MKLSQPSPPTWQRIPSFTKWHLWRQNTIPLMHRDHLVGNPYFVPYFVPLLVFYTESIIIGPHFIPESIFYTQSVVRSLQSMFYTDRLWDTEDPVHFYHHYFHSNTFKLQFDREETSPLLLHSIMHKNKPIYFINAGTHNGLLINEVYPTNTNL